MLLTFQLALGSFYYILFLNKWPITKKILLVTKGFEWLMNDSKTDEISQNIRPYFHLLKGESLENIYF